MTAATDSILVNDKCEQRQYDKEQQRKINRTRREREEGREKSRDLCGHKYIVIEIQRDKRYKYDWKYVQQETV